MAGAAQGDHTPRRASGVPSKSRYSGRVRHVRRDAGLGSIARDGGAPDQRPGCRRDRARHYVIRASREWRPDRGAWAAFQREVIKLAARHRLPALYSDHAFATEGGLIAYGPDRVDQFRRAADYVDRILKGEKPADLPVQAPTKYDLAINLKTAKALGIEMPASVLARADEVIE